MIRNPRLSLPAGRLRRAQAVETITLKLWEKHASAGRVFTTWFGESIRN